MQVDIQTCVQLILFWRFKVEIIFLIIFWRPNWKWR